MSEGRTNASRSVILRRVNFGDEDELACLPRQGCRLEIVATAESSHHEVNRLLPGQVIRYKGTFCFLDRFELPGNTAVGLWHLVGFKLRLLPDTVTRVPSENAILDWARDRRGPVAVR